MYAAMPAKITAKKTSKKPAAKKAAAKTHKNGKPTAAESEALRQLRLRLDAEQAWAESRHADRQAGREQGIDDISAEHERAAPNDVWSRRDL